MMQSAITVSIHSTRIHELHRQRQHQSTEKQAQTDINHDVGRDLHGKARCDARLSTAAPFPPAGGGRMYRTQIIEKKKKKENPQK